MIIVNAVYFPHTIINRYSVAKSRYPPFELTPTCLLGIADLSTFLSTLSPPPSLPSSFSPSNSLNALPNASIVSTTPNQPPGFSSTGNSPCSAAILRGDTLSLLRDNRDELLENFSPWVRDGVGDGVRLGVGGRDFLKDAFRGVVGLLGF